MKKIITMILVFAMITTLFVGCGNMTIIDTTWSFDHAIIFLPNGEKIEGQVSSWMDYEASDMIQVSIDGNTYLTHSSNVVLISE